MKKNYNFNYVNRISKPKTDIDFSNVEAANCLYSVLKSSPIVEGRLWHTVDTNEFFYDWKGDRTKLNLTGDSETISSEISKLKSDVAKLNPENIATLAAKLDDAQQSAQLAQQAAAEATKDRKSVV